MDTTFNGTEWMNSPNLMYSALTSNSLSRFFYVANIRCYRSPQQKWPKIKSNSLSINDHSLCEFKQLLHRTAHTPISFSIYDFIIAFNVLPSSLCCAVATLCATLCTRAVLGGWPSCRWLYAQNSHRRAVRNMKWEKKEKKTRFAT